MHSRTFIPKHLPALDGLRGLAILLVIPHNANVFNEHPGWLWPAELLANVGWVGVQLFFVLSGFLITRNLIDSQQADNYYQAFFMRRILRIFPLYYAVLTVTLLVLPHFIEFTPEALHSQRNQIWLWTFLTNWAEPFGGGVQGFPHFWSLAVEEQFYLVWPVLLHGRRPREILSLCAFLIAIALMIRCGLLLTGVKAQAIYMFTVCRMDALAAGAAAAALASTVRGNLLLQNHADKLWWIAGGVGLTGALLTHAYAVYGTATVTFGYTVLSICFALLLLAAIVTPLRSGRLYQGVLKTAVLRSAGKYSYGMYVFHMLIIVGTGSAFADELRRWMPTSYPALYALIICIASYCAAFVSYHGFEKYFLKLKQRFTPARNVALQPST